MIFWSLVILDVLVKRRGRGCATPTSSAPAAAPIEPHNTDRQIKLDFYNDERAWLRVRSLPSAVPIARLHADADTKKKKNLKSET